MWKLEDDVCKLCKCYLIWTLRNSLAEIIKKQGFFLVHIPDFFEIAANFAA
jgi:hypothetical protein